jgi:hypothetical protein
MMVVVLKLRSPTMNFAEKAFWQTFLRLILIQSVLIIGLAMTLFSFYGKSGEYSLALLYGGFVSIIVSLLRAWRLKIATEDADIAFDARVDNSDSLPKMELTDTLKKDPNTVSGVSALELYKGFAFGYIAAIALLALGLGGLKLEPAAVIIGFVAAQLGHFFVRPPRPGAGRSPKR